MSNNGKPTALQSELETAVSSFEGFLTPEEDKVEEPVNEETIEEVEEPLEEESLAEDLIEEEVEEESEAEEEIEEDEEDSESDEEQTEVEEELEQPVAYTIKIDGIEQEVTLDELQSGYSRQQDYTRKTQKLAEQAKLVEQRQKEIDERDAIYEQLLPKMEAALNGDLANEPDWNKLYEDDPIAYVREKQLWDEKKERLTSVSAEQERLEKEKLEQQQNQLKEFIEFGNQKLLEVIPEWQKPEVAQQEKAEIRDYAINVLGYTPQEMDQVYDYRALLGFRQAWLNNRTVEATKKKPTQKAPARVAKPGSVAKVKTTTPAKKARQKLAKSGKTTDAAKVFEQLI
jgi:hypothetical protein|tara:strand:+ start:545 stop:1573 length:1029 start_codon:yes stop_codon:yes gene_type:complete